MVNRHTDRTPVPHRDPLPPLAVIDWQRVGHEAPERVKINYRGKGAALPKADVVVMTWTSAEWSALDHVFLNSESIRYRSSRDWERYWYQYSRKAPRSEFSVLWGYYQMVTIKTAGGAERSVLLYKSGAHLAYAPWIDGLSRMMSYIIDEAQPDRIYTIGTAGGSSEVENLGDTAITNSGHIQLKKPENINVDYNDTTITGRWFPSFDLVPEVEQQLLFPLSNVVTHDELAYLLYELHEEDEGSRKFGFDDLVNAPLQPGNLDSPRGLDKKGIPLLTTDYYFIASGDDAAEYCALEMDDTVIGHDANAAGVESAFVRNISDPLVPDKSASGEPIPDDVREDWSGLIYKNFGIYTSVNGALLTWATIAGEAGK